MGKFVVSLACATAFTIVSAAAATSVAGLGPVAGKVLVDQGSGFAPASGTIELHQGDRVFVGQNSSATINYGSCSLMIKKATVYSVAAAAPCAKNEKTASLQDDGNVVITPANWGAAGGGGASFFSGGSAIFYAAGAAIVSGAIYVGVFRPGVHNGDCNCGPVSAP
ncbi:hypothetical protein [Aestuariivirga litoralis]|uniref:hypothetical protein n=1 Tax=Aestuariivirga litoralis TaxID=2650924 RepID=UPI0018C7E011|nr:hypothetical protein [Aestuariivirga litoralis]MBG1233220.1 hypothetical protein [Aestuariivirga litoralis]